MFFVFFSCPVLKDIDLDGLSKFYWKLELTSCALGCLLIAVIPKTDKIKVRVKAFGLQHEKM